MCWRGLAEAGSRGASHVAPVSLCARRPLFVVKMLVEGDMALIDMFYGVDQAGKVIDA